MEITKEILESLAKACYANGVLNGFVDNSVSFEDSLAEVALNTVLALLEDDNKPLIERS